MGNQMAKAIVGSGIASPLKERPPRKGKDVICRKCGKPMKKIIYSNIAVCENCEKNSYIVFNR